LGNSGMVEVLVLLCPQSDFLSLLKSTCRFTLLALVRVLYSSRFITSAHFFLENRLATEVSLALRDRDFRFLVVALGVGSLGPAGLPLVQDWLE
jgi:hypothetical protein